MLVSHGARTFAENRDVECVSAESLVSERSRRDWEHWKGLLDASLNRNPKWKPEHPPSEENSSGLHAIQDTVGAITWDAAASLAAGVSR